MGQKQFKNNNNKDEYSDDNSNTISDENKDNNQNKKNNKIKTLADQYLHKKYPKYFLHCRKCYQTYLFKIIISKENNLNFEVIYKCSCLEHFQKVSIIQFMKLLEESWNEKINKKKLI